MESTPRFVRQKELGQIVTFLGSLKTSGLLVLYGERYQGRTTLLRQVRNTLESRGLSSLVKYNSFLPSSFLCEGYRSAVARQLVSSSSDVWYRLVRWLRKEGAMENAFFRFGGAFDRIWIRHARKELACYFQALRTQCLLDDTIPNNLLREAVKLTESQWPRLIADALASSKECTTLLVDDLDLVPGSPQFQTLKTFCEDVNPSAITRVVVSVSASSLTTFSPCYNELARVGRIPLMAVRIDPIPRGSTSEPRDIRDPPGTPYIPGIIEPDRADRLSEEDLFDEITSHQYYGQIHAALWFSEHEHDVLATGLVWVFGGLSDHDIPAIAGWLGIPSGLLHHHFSGNQLLHNVAGKWQFIEGWREYVAARNHVGMLIDAVEEHFCVLALAKFRRRAVELGLPSIRGMSESFLCPQTTRLFAQLLRAIRKIANQKTTATPDRQYQDAVSLFKALEVMGPTRSSMWLPLTREIFDRTQHLEVLEFALSDICHNKGALGQEEKDAFLLAVENAQRWSDIGLANNVVDTLIVRRPGLSVWTKEQLNGITQVVYRYADRAKIEEFRMFMSNGQMSLFSEEESQEFDRKSLRRIIGTRYNTSELRVLVSDLEIDWDELPGEIKSEKISELISYLERNGKLKELVDIVRLPRGG
jgi:hypothetical protein